MIGRDAFIDEGVLIGDRVKIQNAALVYHGVTVEDGVFIGPGAILTNDRYPRAITSTGDLARADDWRSARSSLRYGSSIGAGAVVVAGVDVGRFAMVGAGAVVTRERPEPRARRRQPGPPASAGSAPAAPASSTPTAIPAPAEPATGTPPDPELVCAVCGRHYAYVPDAETLEERSGPRQGAPA